MLIRILAAAAFATLSAAAAQAGTLQNGVWTPTNCKDPGNAPMLSDKSPDAYNKSAKPVQAWQDAAKTYQDCMQSETKADQNAIISAANTSLGHLSDQAKALKDSADAAMAKLNGAAKKSN
jgi:hypothetical protein